MIVCVHKKILLLVEIKVKLYQTHASMQKMSTSFFERTMLHRFRTYGTESCSAPLSLELVMIIGMHTELPSVGMLSPF